MRSKEGEESCIPRIILTLNEEKIAFIPYVNLSEQDLVVKKGKVVVRAWPLKGVSNSLETNYRINEESAMELTLEDVTVGPITKEEKNNLINLLQEFRDCIAQGINELECAKSLHMEIQLEHDRPFSHRPYRMARAEQEIVQDIINDLISNNIIRESNSNYSSPIVLVRKKSGDQRLCIDYRRLNTFTIKDNHPLPRIDDQIDRLQGGIYFISLDLKSGYYQIPMSENSKRYTSFVTHAGQYEFNRMPFGLTNAPRVFQRLMNKILGPVGDIASVYLDDVLLHADTIPKALDGLRRVLEILREEGLTLNLKKCSFLMTSVIYLGYDITNGKVRPGLGKIKAVEKFEVPKTVHNIRQFLGLTGHFRHFIKDYALITRPLTSLTRKNTKWKWTSEEGNAFRTLQNNLIKRPVLALFNPKVKTEVHTDASSLGIAGIILQYQSDDKLHPVAYFSRQTSDLECKFHSYELETLAVVETLKKFRSYLLGIEFTVVTDCNALKSTKDKKELIPRIARWWLQIQEFTFTVVYRPGNRMKHVDALSRNPPNEDTVMHIAPADWVLAGQLTDEKLKEIHRVLKQPPKTEYEKNIYKNYALRNGRIYRITARGIQWVVPRGMRQQVVKAAHNDLRHFSVEKTLYRLCENYWFPRMRQYVEQYIACCIQCLYNKRVSGKKEGYLHPIPKEAEPMRTVHVDHLGPFPRSKKGNCHLIAVVDAFTKFAFLKTVKTTKTQYVIDYFKDLFAVHGAPKRIISDQGSAFSSKKFREFCTQNDIQHVKNAVATPRANGQVERLNRTILNALLTSTIEEERWDENIRPVQFAINNVVNKTTGKTPSVLLFGYKPRSSIDSILSDEIIQTSRVIEDIIGERRATYEKVIKEQEKQKLYFDRKRKNPRSYKEGDLVLIEKREPAPNVSRKLVPPYSGPFIVKRVLPNDRYVVTDMEGSHRSSRKYERTVAVDRMKPWCPSGGISGETDAESGEDGVVLSDNEQK